MRRTAALIVLLALVFAAAVAGIVAFSANSRAQTLPLKGHTAGPTAEAGSLAVRLDRFGLALLQRQASRTDGNVVISPFSIHAVLSMILNGAQGRTAAEMQHALHLDAMSLAAADQGWADLIATVQAGRDPEVQIADSLWLREGIAFRPAFLKLNRDYFAADQRPLPTDPATAARDINAWVSKHTAGKIDNIVSPNNFNDLTVLALVNTLHLKVKWTYFDKADTADEPFTLASGARVAVPMMHAQLSASVAADPRYDAIMLATSGPVRVWIVVPKAAQTPEALLDLFARRGLESLYQGATSGREGSLTLPRLHTTFTSNGLVDDLQSMGMRRVFSPDAAELQGIAETSLGNLYVSTILHKTLLDMNEEGVEAAAATVGLVEAAGAPAPGFTIRADRPYLVLLTDKATQAPLFMGIIRDPR